MTNCTATAPSDAKVIRLSVVVPAYNEEENVVPLANEIIDLSQNGMGDAADLLLPQLTDSSLALVAQLDWLRQHSAD